MIDQGGRIIGPYRLETSLGSGGMGEVFRAVHQHLNREVAVKIMHDTFASDPTFQARFLQEAKAAAALAHPNIVEIIDFNQDAGRYFLVMELLPDGSVRTLMQQMVGAGTPLPLATGIDLIRQTADGLAYAHERGMVHRDIKPDNLLLRRAGGPLAGASGYQLKIADFGLAQLGEGGVRTADGTTMGTPAYMSPEQCQGIEIDGRSDIYSLGVVLFEVATGLVPFETKTLSDAVFKHVYTPPPSPRDARPDLPEPLATLILRCLAKNPAERPSSAREVSEALSRLSAPAPAATPQIPSGVTQIGHVEGLRLLLTRDAITVSPGSPVAVPLTLVNLGSSPLQVAVTAQGAPANWLAVPSTPTSIPPSGQAIVHVQVAPPRDSGSRSGEYPITLSAAAVGNPAIAAQSTLRLTIEGFSGLSASLAPTELRGKAGATYSLNVTNAGNAPTTVTPTVRGDAPGMRFSLDSSEITVQPGATASAKLKARAGRRWMTRDTQSRTFTVEMPGTAAAPPGASGVFGGSGAPPPMRGTFIQEPFMPFWLLPVLVIALILGGAGTAYAMTREEDDGDGSTQAMSTTVSATNTIAAPVGQPTAPIGTPTSDGSAGAPTTGALVAVATAPVTPQPTTPEPTEEPAVSETVEIEATEEPTVDAEAPVADGPLIAFSTGRGIENANGNLDIYVMAPDGSGQQPLITDPGDDWTPSWSNDGTRIAWVAKRDGNDEIYVANADGTEQQRLTSDGSNDRFPSWSPDDSRILFSRTINGNDELFTVDPNGFNPTRLTNDPGYDGYANWSLDGSQIAWTSGRTGNNEIFVMNADGSDVTQLTDSPGNDFNPRWPPDGGSIVFVSDRDGDLDLFVKRSDDASVTSIADQGALEVSPVWSPDGSEIAFMRRPVDQSTGSLIVVSVDGSAEREAATGLWSDDAGITWSPDGALISFLRFENGNVEIWTVGSDESGETQLTTNPTFDGNITWLPTGG